jgi:hypothetical protein
MTIEIENKQFELNEIESLTFQTYLATIKNTKPHKDRFRVAVMDKGIPHEYYLRPRSFEYVKTRWCPTGLLQKCEHILLASKPHIQGELNHAEALYKRRASNDEQFKILLTHVSEIEAAIGYTFNNKNLIAQAFIPKGCEISMVNSAALELIGDRVLYTIVIQHLAEVWTKNIDGYIMSVNMATFSDRATGDISNHTFAELFKKAGFTKFLLSTTKTSKKILANGFESIFGAVAIDTNYNFDTLNKVYDKLTA